jgi:hypothetical protein
MVHGWRRSSSLSKKVLLIVGVVYTESLISMPFCRIFGAATTINSLNKELIVLRVQFASKARGAPQSGHSYST